MVKKIAFFYRDIGLGGVQHMMVILANGLAAQGFDVELVLTAATSDFRNELHKNVKIIRLGTMNILKITYRLVKYIWHAKPDTLYTAVPNFNTVAVAAKLLSMTSVNLVISERSDTILEFKNNNWGMYKLCMFAIPLSYRYANHIIAVSGGAADSLAKFGHLDRARIRVIYNPAFSEEIVIQSQMPVEHRWIGGGYKLVVSAGRLVGQKDFSLLIRSFEKVLATDSSYRLIILGEGPDRSKLEALVEQKGLEEYIDLPGSDPNPYRWFARADAYVMTSVWEGFGNVLVQALACGCQVVSIDCPSGPKEILGDGKFGRLVRTRNEADIAKAILESVRNPIPKETLLGRARDFSSEAAVDQYKTVFGV